MDVDPVQLADMKDFRTDLQRALPERYRLGDEIGADGIVVEYRGTDTQKGETVRVAVLRPELTGTEGRQCFKRTCDLMHRLDHPLIVRVVEVGEAGGAPYLVTPFLEDQTLGDLLSREPLLQLEDSISLSCDVLDALCHAHERGVVFRMIHPNGVRLVSWRAVVTDFSYAVDPKQGDVLNSDGIAIGNPTYMSPEMVRGELELDGRADIYSLGVLLYEMLVGEPPFVGPTISSVIGCILETPPNSLHLVRPELPISMSRIVEKALAKIPDDRFQTAQEFSNALNQVSIPPLAPWWRRLWWQVTDRF